MSVTEFREHSHRICKYEVLHYYIDMNKSKVVSRSTSGGKYLVELASLSFQAYEAVENVANNIQEKEDYQEKSVSSVNLDEIPIIFLLEENYLLQSEIAELENLGINLPEANRNQFLDSNLS
ncbi:hypothetical protein FQA39_LY02458 [Lamprigera yunnana]|nr:hypothetical protein FQA39_LY02458 [Lamprigera yunnana]